MLLVKKKENKFVDFSSFLQFEHGLIKKKKGCAKYS